MNKNWTKEGYKLYALKDGFIMNFTMGSSESIENEILAKGSRNYDFWLVEKDGKIDFYSVKIDPMAQGLGIEITKEKTISGTIVEDKRSNYQGFGAFGGGIVVEFINYKIIEKPLEPNKKEIKITLNGIKVNNNYIPCHFSIDNLSNCVWVYARDYGRGTLPEELGAVTNDTDSREDYFETDYIAVTPLNKYFNACKKSAIYSRIKDMKSKIKYCKKQIAIYISGYYQEMYQKELLEAQNSLKSYEAEYQKIA